MKEFMMRHPIASVILGGTAAKLALDVVKLIAFAIPKDEKCLIVGGGTITTTKHADETGKPEEDNDTEETAEEESDDQPADNDQ